VSQEVVPVKTADEKFALDDVIGKGWEVTKAKFWPLLAVLGVNGLMAALVPLASFVMGYGGSLSLDNIGMQLLLGFVSAVIAMTIELGMINVFLMSLDGKKVGADDCFKCVKYLPNYFIVSLLSKSAIAMGFLCFIIPGIILYISFQFAGYFVVEKKLGPIAALKASWTICDGARWQLVLLSIVGYFINFFGFCCFLVGGIPAYMVNGLALAATYRSLLANTPELAHLAPPPLLGEEAVAELLKHDSWPEHLKPAGDGAPAAPAEAAVQDEPKVEQPPAETPPENKQEPSDNS